MLQQYMAAHSSDTPTNLAVDNPGLKASVHMIAVPSREYLSPEIEEASRICLDHTVGVQLHAAS